MGRIKAWRRRARRRAADAREREDFAAALHAFGAGDVERFAEVERFCLFVGCNRSGTSLVASLLNAHRNAVIAHEFHVLPAMRAGHMRDDLFRLALWTDAQFD